MDQISMYDLLPKQNKKLRILVACEESQEVTKAFRQKGHEAYSCDIQPCSGGRPEWHLQDDVLHQAHKFWDMIIAFPPCTHLAVSGARHFEEKIKDGRQQEAIDFFMAIVSIPCEMMAVENPVGIMSTHYRKPDQIINPYEFGHPERKKTCLWLKNLSLLKPTNIVEPEEQIVFKSGKKMGKFMATSFGDGKIRSKTFPGIAKAMADQWG